MVAADETRPDRPFLIVSNRGPVSFDVDADGQPVARKGAGGLVSGMGPMIAGTDTVWLAAAMSEGDRLIARDGVVEREGFRIRLLDLDPATFAMAYDVIGNATLWFVHHHLFDLARRPRFDHRWRQAWDAYRSVNQAFAAAVAETAPPDAIVLVQDYHLTLLAPPLAETRPDLRLVHFAHTPFASPDLFGVLPDEAGAELLAGLAAHHACGFHTERWAESFGACCDRVLGRRPRTFVAPLAPDAADIRAVAAGDRCATELDALDQELAGRQLITRVDRIELSKNIVRGFHAFDDLLERYPRWRGQVVFGAFVYPSREGLAEYLAYRQEVERVVTQVNERWGTDDWTPILLDTSDNFPRSVAALRRYDALLVNPIRDGLNLVAKEGPLVNDHDGMLVLSPESGAWAELGDVAVGANPFDIEATADALDHVLGLDAERRVDAARALREAVERRTPADWLADQLAAAR
jgi:trehalose 6-phosphate synthase